MKRPRLLLVVILIAVAVLCVSLWVGEGPLWRWVMLKSIPLTEIPEGLALGGAVHGWFVTDRWQRDTPSGPIRFYGLDNLAESVQGKAVILFTDTDLKAFECDIRESAMLNATAWNSDGSVREQVRELPFGKQKHAPPWGWGVEDQTP